jgi:hypothetical protein
LRENLSLKGCSIVVVIYCLLLRMSKCIRCWLCLYDSVALKYRTLRENLEYMMLRILVDCYRTPNTSIGL